MLIKQKWGILHESKSQPAPDTQKKNFLWTILSLSITAFHHLWQPDLFPFLVFLHLKAIHGHSMVMSLVRNFKATKQCMLKKCLAMWFVYDLLFVHVDV